MFKREWPGNEAILVKQYVVSIIFDYIWKQIQNAIKKVDLSGLSGLEKASAASQ